MTHVINFVRTTFIIAFIAVLTFGAYALGRERSVHEETLQAAHAAAEALQEQANTARDNLDNVRATLTELAKSFE